MIRWMVGFAFLVFGAFSAWVASQFGYWAAFPPFGDLPTLQIFCDLLVALSLLLWMFYRDLKRRRQALWPLAVCAVGVVLLGSIAPLAFLLLRRDLTRVE